MANHKRKKNKMKLKIRLGLGNMSIPLKIGTARNIVNRITGNPNFTTPVPALAAVTDSITALESAYNTSRKSGPAQTSVMYDKEEILDKLLTQLASYVEFTADGDETIALSSGMNLKNKVTSHPYMFGIVNGKQEGEVKLTTLVKPRATYIWEICVDPFPTFSAVGNNAWKQLKITTLAKVTVGNLTPAQKYWFRVATVVKDVQGSWTDPLSIIVN